jgi:hypothetical protein
MANDYSIILNCIKTKAVAAVGGEAIDCADLALQSLAQCCEDDNVKLSMEVYDSDTGDYIRLKRSAYASVEAFINDLKIKMGAISLHDRDRITKEKPLADLVPGEIILYHLPGNADYTGHTMIVTANNTADEKVVVSEGHISGESPTKGTYTYSELPDKFSDQPKAKFKGGRKWNWSNIVVST